MNHYEAKQEARRERLLARAKLKASGFRWSPTSGAWQRHLGNSAIWAAESLLKEIRAKESA